ncbi:hypothetical protein EXU30_03430 [Shewanella maritima]|uniref:Sulfotransferase n=2 Tax=Shewanella TaxID=22 RepID=A0A411PE92_9GAMM|nr:sulfotransferase [Shewanella maritima]QBF81853.1 hypothetical protein EXU30_03430 [Shewanella maritima]
MSQVFIFSACWRTGSTLIQRFLNTSDDLLIWGEPNYLLPFHNAFTKSVAHFKAVEWQHTSLEELGFQKAWIPVLNPKSQQLLEGYRAFFNTTYGGQLAQYGKRRWGFKEVRQNAYQHAEMMKTLFPDCKIIFHYRNPYEVYESLLSTDFHQSFNDPYQPIRFWANNMKDFIDTAKIERLGAIVIAHEDFVDEVKSMSEMEKVASFAGVKLTTTMVETLHHKVGGTSSQVGLEANVVNKIDQVISGTLGQELSEKVMSLFAKPKLA